MRKHYLTIFNGLAKGLELERQASQDDIGLEVPDLPPGGPEFFAVRGIVTIDGHRYEVDLRRTTLQRGVYPNGSN